MIAKLRGTVDSVGEDWVIVDVGGVGYLVFCSARSLRAMTAAGEPVVLLIETHVREDHIHLYGFIDAIERDWFTILLAVQGVGTRVALSLLSALPPGELAQAIAARDRAALGRANGVGPKLAARLVTELKDKVANLPGLASTGAGDGLEGPGNLEGASADAVSALINLGYRRADVLRAVATASRRHEGSTKAALLVREGLAELNR